MHTAHRPAVFLLAALAAVSAVEPATAQIGSCPGNKYPCLYCPDGTTGSDSDLVCFINRQAIKTNPLQGLGVSRPIGMAFSPDNKYLYLTSLDSDSYSIMTIASGGADLQPVRDVGGNPLHINMQFTPCNPVDAVVQNDKLYVACLDPPGTGTRTEEGHIEVFRKGDFDYASIPSTPGRIDVDPNPGSIDTQPYTAITDLLPSKDGQHLYVSYVEQQKCDFLEFQFGSLAIVDTTSDQVVDKFPTQPLCNRPGGLEMLEPANMALSPDGRTLYVTLHKSSPSQVGSIGLSAAGDRFTAATFSPIILCRDVNCSDPDDENAKDPAGILVTRDGSKLYVTHNGLTGVPRFRISVINTASRSVSQRIDLPGPSDPNFIDYNPTAPALSRDGSKLLVPLFGDDNNPGNHIAVINTASDTLDLGATILVPRSADGAGVTKETQPFTLLLHPTAPFAYVAGHVTGTVVVLLAEPPPVPELSIAALVAAVLLLGLALRRTRARGAT
jgi:DNA-binding beta-propeller fold protein YncE